MIFYPVDPKPFDLLHMFLIAIVIGKHLEILG